MKKILSKISLSSLSSSDSYNSLKEIDKPKHIHCPICLMETDNNKILKCKHGICKTCFKELKKTGLYKCPICRKEYGSKIRNTTIPYEFLGFSIGGLTV